MRGWIVLVELAFSIIILTFFFLYNYYHQNTLTSLNEYYDPNKFRYLNESCNDNNLIYEIINLTNYNITVCFFGNYTNLSDVSNFHPVFEYLYSGKSNYSPYILIILS
ncbi:MAG: hypothetical protein ACP5G1_01135 [Nanopusillaceae archaeon]